MRRIITVLCLSVSVSGFAQQWAGSNNMDGLIERNGNIKANNLYFGRYGGPIVGDSNPFNIYSDGNSGEHDFLLFGSSGATLHMRLFDGHLKLGSNTTPNTILYNNGEAYFGSNVAITGNLTVGREVIEVVTGYGKTLSFLGASVNGDPLWMSRYNNGSDNSELRVNIGDDYGQAQDMFVVGTHHWNGGAWNPHLVVQASGRVGIGTTTPQKLLDVRTGIDNYASIGHTLGIGGFSGIHFGYLEADNLLYRKSAIVFERLDNAARGKIHFLNNGTWSEASATLSDSKMTIDFNGNVGIGTTTPDAKLAVKGHIHTQEVRVDLEGTMAPDYVFEETYNLPTLASTEAYIKQHKHLPEIPSACEMEENGLNLKEMNLLLLKKIEELTLHVIEQNRINQQQQKLIEALLNEQTKK